MGNGIAHVFAQYGYNVHLVDLDESHVDKGIKTISANLDRQVKKGTLTEDQKKATLARIKGGSHLATAMKNADLVVEAVSEKLDTKLKLMHELDQITPPNCILATNTSSISITQIAAATGRPDKVIGMHFMNPVPLMKLVEVIRGYNTSDATNNAIVALTKDIEKEPLVANDYPGFVSNRILMPMINEAIYTLYEGIATREAIDGIMKLGMNHPMGPLALADFIGLDICLKILNVLYSGFGNPKYAPCPLLVNMVAAGHLGRKTGKGFYDYTAK
jgi:3-hydroxybutyryl-CoA dehydrogenase